MSKGEERRSAEEPEEKAESAERFQPVGSGVGSN